MANLTAAEVTNWFLYGQATTPADLTQQNIIRPPLGSQPLIEVGQDLASYMTSGPGRFATGSQFGHVANFFAKDSNGNWLYDVPAGNYSQPAIASHVGWAGQFRHIAFQNWHFDDGAGDYAERVYIWNTVAFEIDDGAQFVVTASGERYINNFAVKPYLNPGQRENFDFVSSDVMALLGNTQDNIDPSRIGRTVNFDFTGPVVTTIYDESNFQSDLAYRSTWTIHSIVPPSLVTQIQQIEQDLWDSGVIKYLDDDNRPIIYGTVGDDVAISWLLVKDHLYLGAYVENGVRIIAGAGTDELRGSPNNDYLEGGAGNDTILAGNGQDLAFAGEGNDSVDGGAGNDFLDGGAGTDTALFETITGRVNIKQLDSADVPDGVEDNGSPVFEVSFKRSGNDEQDFLRDFEHVQFGDGVLRLVTEREFNTGQGGFLKIDGGGSGILDFSKAIEIVTSVQTLDSVEHTTLGNVAVAGFATVVGSADNDEIRMGDGDQKIYGGDGDDILSGGAGNDILDGGAGDDQFEGGDGADTFIVGLSGGAGEVILDADASDRLFIRLSTIIGSDSENSPEAEVLVPITGGFFLYAAWEEPPGATLATHSAQFWPVTWSSTEDFDPEPLYSALGTDFEVTFDLDGSDLYIGIAFSGGTTFIKVNDYQAGDLGLQFAEIVDPLQVDGVQEWFESAKSAWDAGHSVSFSALETIGDFREPDVGTDVGTDDDDNMVGSSGDDTIESGGGNDTIDALSGDDIARGGGGNDLISGGAGRDFLYGESGDDTIDGGDDDDTIYGGSGSDLIAGGAGADTLIGGTGSDTASYVTSSAGVTVNLTTGVHSGGDAAGDTLVAIENVTGSAYDDTLTGDSGANVLDGGAGDDLFYFAVGGAADRIDGGAETVADTLDITGTGAADAFFIETTADYNTRTGAGYAGPAEVLVSVGSTIQTEVNEIETIAIHGGAGADTLTIPGSFTGTALASSAFMFDGGTGDDTVDVSNRTSAHKIVADGGDEDTATGDVAILGFDFDDVTSFERIEDGSGNLIGVKITHDIGGTPVTDEFTDFENFQFTDGTKTLEELSPLSSSFTSALGGHSELASLSSAGVQGNNGSFPNSTNADGRYAVFMSSATNLVSGDTNGERDIFVRDLYSGTTTRVSVDSSGTQANGDNSMASISADGRYAVFDSLASNLVAGDTNGQYDIFMRDLVNGTTTRVSVGSAGAQATGGPSSNPDISADGRYVVFQSFATNLVAGDTNGHFDVFVRDLVAGTTTRASVSSAGAQATGGTSVQPSISADGRYVVFGSDATNLVAGDTGFHDVFVRDLVAGTTTRVSLNTSGGQANGNSGGASISADGRYVVFQSDASNLVAGDTNGASDIFVRDRTTGTTTRVSVDSSGSQGNSFSTLGGRGPAISDNGRYVVFESNASNLVAGDTNGLPDVFMRDLITGITTRLSTRWDGTQTSNSSLYPAISGDGGTVLFYSPDEDLDPNDANLTNDTFVLERALLSNEVALNVTSSAPTADTFKIEWGDGQTTFHSLWGGAEQLVRHDYAANVSGTGTIHVMSGGSDIETTTFAVQTAPSGTSATSLTGTAGVDVLIGNDGANTLSGLGGNDMLSGGLGADSVDGGAGADNLRGGAGNDTLTGGSGSDTFVFETGFGQDTVTDFVAGSGTDDVIEFHNGIFADFAAVQAASSQVGSDVVITVDGSNSILLTNVTLANLHQDDFLFV